MDLDAVVRKIAEEIGDRAVFIGGVAFEAYTPYRRTYGVDLLVREHDLPALKALLDKAGFAHSRSPHLHKHAFKGREAGEIDAFTTAIGEVPVDEGLFERAREVTYAGDRIFAASLEDLLRLKLLAGREMDLSDVAVLLHARAGEANATLLEGMVPIETLRRAAALIPDLLPPEYGWEARQKLKAWLRERGWLARR